MAGELKLVAPGNDVTYVSGLRAQRSCQMVKKPASSKSKKIHVISRDGGWAVKSEGATRASRIYKTKDAAVSGATKSSRCRDIVIHKRDGSIDKWKKSK